MTLCLDDSGVAVSKVLEPHNFELFVSLNEPPHDKTNKMICAPSEDSDQTWHPPSLPSLIRVFAVRSMGSWGPDVSSCGQRRLWSDWADAQADLSLRWAHMPFDWFCHEVVQMLETFAIQYKNNLHQRYSTVVPYRRDNQSYLYCPSKQKSFFK